MLGDMGGAEGAEGPSRGSGGAEGAEGPLRGLEGRETVRALGAVAATRSGDTARREGEGGEGVSAVVGAERERALPRRGPELRGKAISAGGS